MILTCPACRTRYTVPDNAIGSAGRQVRCASCKHSWFQTGHEIEDAPEPSAFAEAAPPAPADPVPAAETMAGPEPVPEPTPDYASEAVVQPAHHEPEPYEAAPEPESEEAVAEQSTSDFDAFAAEPPFRPRPARGRLWLIALLILALLLAAGAAAVLWVGVPGLEKYSLKQKGTPLRLQVPVRPQRQKMASGNELLAVTGMIVNPTDQPHRVPKIQAELRDAHDRLVYQWEISPPVPILEPRQTVTFNSAEVDFPQSARRFNVHFVES